MSAAAALSPAQKCVLLEPNNITGFVPIKATLLLMLTTGVLRMVETEERGFFRAKKVAHLCIAASPQNPPPEIAVLLDLVHKAQPAGGRIADLVKLAKNTFGTGCNKFLVTYVYPTLIDRGLLVRGKILFLTHYRFTPTGKNERDRIKADLAKCDEVARLLDSNPARAAALAASLGATVLLSTKLTKRFKPLADAMRGSGLGGPVLADGTFSPGHFDFSHFNAGSFNIGRLDAGAIDAVHHGMSSFDSGFSDGGGGHHNGGGGGGHH